MNTTAGALGTALLIMGCSRAPARESIGDDPALAAMATERRDASSATRRVAEVTPEIATKAADILRSNPGAEMGAEFPFEIAGRSYVARVEEHDNSNGDPNRPLGRHKGITVYSTD